MRLRSFYRNNTQQTTSINDFASLKNRAHTGDILMLQCDMQKSFKSNTLLNQRNNIQTPVVNISENLLKPIIATLLHTNCIERTIIFCQNRNSKALSTGDC